MKYAFVLGREPALSTAELVSTLRAADVGFDPRAADYSSSVMIAETAKPLDESFFHALGGTIKMAEVLGASMGKIEDDLYDVLDQREGSVDFGLSLYALNNAGTSAYHSLERGLKALSLTLKKRLKESGRSVRAVLNEDVALTSVQVDKNKLIQKGAELLILVGQGTILIARTLAVQDFESFSGRDFGRPGRDARSGMLPPKLARLMVNLTEAPKSGVLLDPFCGSGTVLTEGALLGYRKLIGSDVSEKAVSDSRVNFTWTANRTGLAGIEPKLFVCDVKNLAKELKPASVDAIATEPFLGPPLKGDESDQKIHHEYLELMGLYRRAFAAFAEVLKPGASAVFVFPVFGNKHVNLLRELEELGFKAEALLPGKAMIALGARSATGLMYRRPDQLVGRDIFRFRFKK